MNRLLVGFSGHFLGGAEKVLLDALSMFQEEGIEPVVLLNGGDYLSSKPGDKENAEIGEAKDKSAHLEVSRELELLGLPPSRILQQPEFASKSNLLAWLHNLFSTVSFLRRTKPSLVLVEGKFLTQLLAPACFLFRVPLIGWIHYPPSSWELNRCFYWLASRLILCSEALKPYLGESRVKDARVFVLRNYVDSERFCLAESDQKRTELRGSFGLEEEDIVLCLVGHLSQVKGQAEAIEALALIREKFSSGTRASSKESGEASFGKVKLLLAGADNSEDQTNLDSLEKKVAALSLTENVRFLGKISEIETLYQSSDIMLLPSFREGLPLSILEAMSCGLPVLASDVDGNSEAVIDGETGYLVPAGNVEKLAEAMEELIGSEVLRESFSQSGRQRIFENFSEEKFRADLLAHLRDYGFSVGL